MMIIKFAVSFYAESYYERHEELVRCIEKKLNDSPEIREKINDMDDRDITVVVEVIGT